MVEETWKMALVVKLEKRLDEGNRGYGKTSSRTPAKKLQA